jgi:hypothetical protein
VSFESLIRYPADGAISLFGDTTPQEGDELTRDGDTWVIEEVIQADDGEVVVRARPSPRELPSDDDDEPG